MMDERIYYFLYETIRAMEARTIHVRDCYGALMIDTADLLLAEAEGRWPWWKWELEILRACGAEDVFV